MAHKVIEIRKGFPYSETSVPFERSLQQIQTLLEKFGCSRVMTLKEGDTSSPLNSLFFEHRGAQFMIEFPITFRKGRGKTHRLVMAISGRIVHDRVKAALVEVEVGYLDFSQAMIGYRALPGPDGTTITMTDYVDQHQGELQSGRFELKMLPDDQ